MNKDRQRIEHDLEHVIVLAMKTKQESLSVECHIFATTSIWRLSVLVYVFDDYNL